MASIFRSLQPRHRVVPLVLGLLLLSACFIDYRIWYLSSSWSWGIHQPSWYQQYDESIGNTAAIFVCLWECDVPLLTAAIATLRARGGFCGPVYVVCNAVSARQLPVYVNRLLLSDTLLSQLDMDSIRQEQWGAKIHRGMIAKRLKPQLFRLVPDTISRVVFIDADILTISSIHELLTAPTTAQPWHMITDVLTLCKLRNLPHCNQHPFNSGVMVMQRTLELEGCLQHWLEQLNDQSLIMDQQALHAMLLGHPECEPLIQRWPRSKERYLMPAIVPSMLASNEWFVHFLGVKRHTMWPTLRRKSLAGVEHELKYGNDLCAYQGVLEHPEEQVLVFSNQGVVGVA